MCPVTSKLGRALYDPIFNIMTQTNKVSLKHKKDIKINPFTNNKINLQIDYFVSGPNTKADRAVKTTMKMHDELVMCSEVMNAPRAHSPKKLKMRQRHIRCHKDA